jgi:phosphorylcholine metabolism protein LicD
MNINIMNSKNFYLLKNNKLNKIVKPIINSNLDVSFIDISFIDTSSNILNKSIPKKKIWKKNFNMFKNNYNKKNNKKNISINKMVNDLSINNLNYLKINETNDISINDIQPVKRILNNNFKYLKKSKPIEIMDISINETNDISINDIQPVKRILNNNFKYLKKSKPIEIMDISINETNDISINDIQPVKRIINNNFKYLKMSKQSLSIPKKNILINNEDILTTKENRFKKCLEDMKEILEYNSQRFFLVWGTLLGCYRNKRFISYDGDIDIGILYEDFDVKIIDKIVESGKFKLNKIYGEINKNLELALVNKNGIKIDIFIYYKISDDYYYTSTFLDICALKPEGFCKWGRHIRGFMEYDFYGKKYLIPKNIEEHLTETYGDDFMIPKKFTYREGLKIGYKNLIN